MVLILIRWRRMLTVFHLKNGLHATWRKGRQRSLIMLALYDQEVHRLKSLNFLLPIMYFIIVALPQLWNDFWNFELFIYTEENNTDVISVPVCFSIIYYFSICLSPWILQIRTKYYLTFSRYVTQVLVSIVSHEHHIILCRVFFGRIDILKFHLFNLKDQEMGWG